ncbi:MAG: SCP2 sterol-binding domain-containing protein [Gammaproteobacteria bacterium]|nr:SCP2 sterol-binding domain-containing protein [Gammaproteobacteria bacterium]
MKRRLLERAEALINRYVAESTAASDLVAELDGRSFAIRVEGFAVGCTLRAENGRVRVADEASAKADAAISGTPLDLLRLLGPDMASRLTRSPARLTGSSHVAERFGDVLRLARPDLEEELAGWIGDVAAHEIGRRSRAALDWALKAADALRLDTTEYLQEESRVLPCGYEAESFYAEVERLRDDVERAAERVDRLAARIAAP